MKRLSTMVLGFLILLGAAVVYFEFVQPEHANLVAKKGQAAGEATLLAQEKALQSQAQAILTTYQSQGSSTQPINLAMPVGPNSAGALAQIYGLATNSGLSLQSVNLSTQSVVESSANASDAASVLKPMGSISLQFTVNGSYEAMKTFLQGLENNVRIFDLTGFSIHSGTTVSAGGPVVTGASDNYTFDITAVAYYQSS